MKKKLPPADSTAEVLADLRHSGSGLPASGFGLPRTDEKKLPPAYSTAEVLSDRLRVAPCRKKKTTSSRLDRRSSLWPPAFRLGASRSGLLAPTFRPRPPRLPAPASRLRPPGTGLPAPAFRLRPSGSGLPAPAPRLRPPGFGFLDPVFRHRATASWSSGTTSCRLDRPAALRPPPPTSQPRPPGCEFR